MDLCGKIMAWEAGEMTEDQAVEFFQELIDSGHAWTLQGCYGRTAAAFIEAGLCHRKGEVDHGEEHKGNGSGAGVEEDVHGG